MPSMEVREQRETQRTERDLNPVPRSRTVSRTLPFRCSSFRAGSLSPAREKRELLVGARAPAIPAPAPSSSPAHRGG